MPAAPGSQEEELFEERGSDQGIVKQNDLSLSGQRGRLGEGVGLTVKWDTGM